MAGVNTLYDHPIYANGAIALTTASGVHAATVAEYAMTTILALAHRVPRMVEWQGKGARPPPAQRGPRFVPTPPRGGTPRGIGPGATRGREGAHRQDRVRDDRARVQARPEAARGPRLLPAGHGRSSGRAGGRVVLARSPGHPAGALRRGRHVRAAHPRGSSHDRRAPATRHEA